MRPSVRLSALSQLRLDLRLHARHIGRSAKTARRTRRSSTSGATRNPGSARHPSGRCQRDAPYAWRVAIENRHRPTTLSLTRQTFPHSTGSGIRPPKGSARGAYVMNPNVDKPDVLLLATGSEVHLVVAAEKTLAEKGIRARLVSMPCWELFEEQPADYREAVLPRAVTRRLSVESGVTLGWQKWVGDRGTFDRHRPLRSFGAGTAPHEGVRLHRGSRRRRDAGDDVTNAALVEGSELVEPMTTSVESPGRSNAGVRTRRSR